VSAPQTFLDAALMAAGNAWPVFPLRPGQKRPLAELTSWERRATTETSRITAWWRHHPHDNVAIATGPAGLLVVDLDLAQSDEPRPVDHPNADGGIDVFAYLAERHGDGGAPTWTVETPSGGRHLYYRRPLHGGPWRNTAGRLGWHIDTRGGGGYVVAAGSVIERRRYIVVDDHPPAELPRWIADALVPSSIPKAATSPPIRAGGGYGAAALAGEVARVLHAPIGQRNAALNRAAWNLARHIVTGHLPRAAVEEALCAAGRAAGGQTPGGVAATVRSAIDARLRRQGEGT
jgi:hypothetical protein